MNSFTGLQKMSLKITSLISFSLLAASCATLWGGGSDAKTEKPHKEIIVQRAGYKNNQVDGKRRSYWVDKYQTTKNAKTKMVAALASGEPDASEIHARKILAQRPGDLEALNILVASLAQKKNYSLAAFYAKQILKKDPENSLALNVIGVSRLMVTNPGMSHFRQARSYFEKAVQASEKEIAGALNMAYLQLELGNPQSAHEYFSLAHSRCEGCYYATLGRGISAARVGKVDQAKGDFEALLDENEKDGEAMYRLALLSKNGYNDLDQAQKQLRLLLADAKADDFLRTRAHVLMRKIEDQNRGSRNTAVAGTRKDKSSPSTSGSDDIGGLIQVMEDE